MKTVCSQCEEKRSQFIYLKCTHKLCFECYQKSKNKNKIKKCFCGQTITIFNLKNEKELNENNNYFQCGFICEDLFLRNNIKQLTCFHNICDSCKKIYDNLSQKNEFKIKYCPYLDCKSEIEEESDDPQKIERNTEKSLIKCPFCNNIIENQNKITLDCMHVLCKPCLQTFIENLSNYTN